MDPQDTIETGFRAVQDALPVDARVARDGPLPESRLKWETAPRVTSAAPSAVARA